MINAKTLALIFIPAILIAGVGLFVRVMQYEPLFPDADSKEDTLSINEIVPIFPEDILIGNPRAPQTLIAFEDLGCHSCKQQYDFLTQLQETYPNKFKIIWKALSVTRFPFSSELTNTYGYCAYQQNKFHAFVPKAFMYIDNMSAEQLTKIADEIELNSRKLSACLQNEETMLYLQKNKQLAYSLQIQSVPTFFLNNSQIHTPQSLTEWEQVLGLTN